MTRIRIVGAHSTGKTRLATWIADRYQIPLIKEVAREVLREMGAPIDEIRTDPALIDQYQKSILERQIQAEQAPGPWVSDRSIDCLAYTVAHAPNTFLDSQLGAVREWAREISREPVFICRPHPSMLEEDGVRETPTWESVCRIDSAVEMLLSILEIPFIPLAGPSFVDRTRTVRYVLDPLNASMSTDSSGARS